jgi:hypothetical protein
MQTRWLSRRRQWLTLILLLLALVVCNVRLIPFVTQTLPPRHTGLHVESAGDAPHHNATAASLQIVVLTMDRFQSLTRLVDSLRASDYGSDRVDLRIRFDRPKHPTEVWEERVAQWRANLTWAAGHVEIWVSDEPMGLRQAWLSAWIPSSVDECAMILEDDIEVSPLWYRWWQGTSEAYGNRTDEIAGISLQRQTLVPLKTARDNVIPDHDGWPFLYKLVGSIGYAPLAPVWLDFLAFCECALATNMAVATPDLVTSDWYQVLDQTTMWTQLFIYFCRYYDLSTLYAFPSDGGALAAHWREQGAHYAHTGGPDFRLSQQVRFDYPMDVPRLDWDARPVRPVPPLRTLVMSAAVGYPLHVFDRFVQNLRAYYHGDVALLVWDGAPPEVFALLERYNIRAVSTPEGGGPRSSEAWLSVNRVRWQFYQDVCQEDQYDLCMAVDFRDTLFQDHPFRGMHQAEPVGAILHVYEHNLVMNAWHLAEAVNCNQSELVLKRKKIFNAGGFVGSPQAFPQLAWLILEKAKGCDDQVALNLGVHGKLLNGTVYSHRQGEGNINNVAWDAIFRLDNRQRFLNHNCFPVPAAHQFDLVTPQPTPPLPRASLWRTVVDFIRLSRWTWWDWGKQSR